MATVTAKYLGDLRVECTHALASGTKLVSDARGQQRQGRSLFPTDLS